MGTPRTPKSLGTLSVWQGAYRGGGIYLPPLETVKRKETRDPRGRALSRSRSGLLVPLWLSLKPSTARAGWLSGWGGDRAGRTIGRRPFTWLEGSPLSAMNQIKALPLPLVFQGHQSPHTHTDKPGVVETQASASHT